MDQKNSKYAYVLALSALGIVYGDIGTSPLYALKESFHESHQLGVIPLNILGILSLIFWSLISIVSVKYLTFIVKADNQGEGGILALMTLVSSNIKKSPKTARVLTLMGLFGTALLYGDGIITPAISVLSAVEGLENLTPHFKPYIIPITVCILVGLFMIQKHGTSKVGRIFGPVTLVWFVVLGSLGVYQIIQNPEILIAVNPYHAFVFFKVNAWKGFIVLGSVFLVVTGGEALYSDLGHFGKRPIRLAWFIVVLPCLILNYFGQGAMLLRLPENIKSPFYLMAPDWAMLPLIILATLSTVIASQALITAVFSLTMQAVQLQIIPRVTIAHTSNKEFGQVYVKSMNYFLMFSCISLVLIFKSSSSLASAYGIAVTTTMLITTILFYYYVTHAWNWNKFLAVLVCGSFLILELSFWGANLLKLLDGGWLPISVGLVIFVLMTTWTKGRVLVTKRTKHTHKHMGDFLDNIKSLDLHRIPGAAVYLCADPELAPTTVIQTSNYFQSLHETIIFLTVKIVDTPFVRDRNRIVTKKIADNTYTIEILYGYMGMPDVKKALSEEVVFEDGTKFDSKNAVFFISGERILATDREGMAIWREKLFGFMLRNGQTASEYLGLPAGRVLELSTFVDI